jgi:hypothetical protein
MSMRPDKQPRRGFLKTLAAAGAGTVFAGNASPAAAAETPAFGPVPKRKFGRHSEMISSLALGGATLAHAESIEEATRIVAAAIDWGVTFFDNAWEYSDGRAEEWMGIAMRGKRDKVFLMSKVCTHLKGQETKDKALAMLENSLRRLKTDHLDLWQVHQILTEAEADSIFMPGGVLEAIEQAKKQGTPTPKCISAFFRTTTLLIRCKCRCRYLMGTRTGFKSLSCRNCSSRASRRSR